MLKPCYPHNFIGITSEFGPRKITNKISNHRGLDLGHNKKYGGSSSDLIACCNATVVDIKTSVKNNEGSGYGNYLVLQSILNKDFTYFYAHLNYNGFKIKKGDQVKQGDVICKMGNTGQSSGAHLHIEIRYKGFKIDPINHFFAYPNQVVASKTIKEFGIKILRNNSKPFILTRTLKLNCKGNDVKELQKALNRVINANLVIDGSFGPLTLTALNNYKEATLGLKADNTCGEKTAVMLGWRWQKK